MMVAPTTGKDGDRMIGRSLLAACLLLTLAVGRAEASDEGLCDRLFVPEGYELDCQVKNEPGQAAWVLTVHPVEGAFAPLSELTIRPVTETIDDPRAWLREQLTLDVSSFDATIEDLLHGDDSPLADTPIVGQLESWRNLLHQAAGWPLAGCEEPETGADDDSWRMSCKWELGPFHQFMTLRLVTVDGQRYTMKIRAVNEHRMRNLVAIANSF
jgi:hypothetical protein